MRPYLLLDVDGVLNPDFRQTWDGPAGDTARADGWVMVVKPGGDPFIFNERPVWLNVHHGRKLLALAEKAGAELVWATRWHDLANQLLTVVIGLPPMPVIWCNPAAGKPDSVIPWTMGRPFTWLDDEDGVVAACEAVPGGSAVKVDPLAGLTDADLELAAALLAGVVTG